MRHRHPTLATLATLVLATLFAAAASAQGNRAPAAADTGFFRPSADPNITGPLPEERPRPAEALTAEDKVQAKQETVAHDRAPDPLEVMRWSEQQMDRVEQDTTKARPKPGTPAPINGAFTGQTDERSR